MYSYIIHISRSFGSLTLARDKPGCLLAFVGPMQWHAPIESNLHLNLTKELRATIGGYCILSYYILYTIYYILYTIYYILYTIYYILYTFKGSAFLDLNPFPEPRTCCHSRAPVILQRACCNVGTNSNHHQHLDLNPSYSGGSRP